MLAEQRITQAFISESLKYPVGKIDNKIIANVAYISGLDPKLVEQVLHKKFPNGSINAFHDKLFTEMAFKGRDEATEFEVATVEIFNNIFGMEAKHVGPIGLTPDVLVISDDAGFTGIIDNKAYSNIQFQE